MRGRPDVQQRHPIITEMDGIVVVLIMPSEDQQYEAPAADDDDDDENILKCFWNIE